MTGSRPVRITSRKSVHIARLPLMSRSPGKTSRRPPAGHRHEDAVRLERDRPRGAVDPGDPEPAQRRRRPPTSAPACRPPPAAIPAPPPACSARARRRAPGRNPWADSTSSPMLANRSIQWTPPSKSAPPPAIAGSSRQPARRWLFTATRWKNRTSPSEPEAIDLAEHPRHRLVAVVLRHHEPAARSALRRASPARSPTASEKGRLLQHDVLSRLQRREGQIEMGVGRRRDHDGARPADPPSPRRRSRTRRRRELAVVPLGQRGIAAGVVALHLAAEAGEHLGVGPGRRRRSRGRRG